MTLGAKRRKFTHMLALLILYAEGLGFGVAVRECFRDEDCTHGHPESAHRSGLAGDLDLYDAEDSYLIDGKYHKKLHDFWDAIGGAKRIDGDLNHYSLKHRGVR
jgi:hypothetical protein